MFFNKENKFAKAKTARARQKQKAAILSYYLKAQKTDNKNNKIK